MITQDYLKFLFSYNLFGALIWSSNRGPNQTKGTVAGWFDKSSGYIRVSVDNKNYLVHRLIWIYHYGIFENDTIEIDHINFDKTDNRIENLRLATRQQNEHNKPKRRNCTSKFTGVHWNSRDKRWVARGVSGEGRRINLGSFLDEDAAEKIATDYQKDIEKEFHPKSE